MKIIACFSLALIIIALTTLVSYNYFGNNIRDLSNHTHRDVINEATTQLPTNSEYYTSGVGQTAISNEKTSYTPLFNLDDGSGEQGDSSDNTILDDGSGSGNLETFTKETFGYVETDSRGPYKGYRRSESTVDPVSGDLNQNYTSNGSLESEVKMESAFHDLQKEIEFHDEGLIPATEQREAGNVSETTNLNDLREENRLAIEVKQNASQ